MQSQQSPYDLPRTTLGVLVLLGLIGGAMWILRPFLPATMWATTIVIATWPVLKRLQARLWGKRSLAAAVLTLALLLVLIIPLSVAVGSLVGNMDAIRAHVASLQHFSLPPPPEWVAGIPLIGRKADETWRGLAVEGSGGLPARIQPYARRVLEWCASSLGSVAGMILQFLLTVVIAGILYMQGERAAGAARRFASRLAGDKGDQAAVLAAGAIRGVAMGVVVTALAQSAVAGIGLVICSVPGAMLLTSVILVLCLAQLGPILVMVPATIWKFYAGGSVWGGVLLVFTILSGPMAAFLRPVLIKKGADLPLLLILTGVIGGMIGFGIMGIFMGPVILAVAYTLLGDWIASKN
jgi:predicted PurR-regulated permease PerM